MKKTYITPKIDVVVLQQQTALLTGSTLSLGDPDEETDDQW
jgi:hypothetical protein